MAKVFQIDVSEPKAFFTKLHSAAKGDFKQDLETFLEGIGMEFLRVCTEEIERRKVIGITSLLINSFQKGDVNNVWTWSDGNMTLEIGTNVEYAEWVNDGHKTCPEGEIGRFVPGTWRGDKFVYDPSAKTGMYLKQQWVEGSHYWESALKIMEKMFPKLLDAKLRTWLTMYFAEFG